MNDTRWAWIFTLLAIVLFAGTLWRSGYLNHEVMRLPCDDPSLAGNSVMAAPHPPAPAPAPSVAPCNRARDR